MPASVMLEYKLCPLLYDAQARREKPDNESTAPKAPAQINGTGSCVIYDVEKHKTAREHLDPIENLVPGYTVRTLLFLCGVCTTMNQLN